MTKSRKTGDLVNAVLVDSNNNVTLYNAAVSGTLSVTGSLFATSSQALTASYAFYAVSASHEIIKEVSSSHADTASYVNPLNQNVIVTGSVLITGSQDTQGNIQIATGKRIGSNVDSSNFHGFIMSSNPVYLYPRAGSSHYIRWSTDGLLQQYVGGANGVGYFSSAEMLFGGTNQGSATIRASSGLVTISGGSSGLSLGARLGIRGSGTTSSTTALRVENANASVSLQVRDDGSVLAKSVQVPDSSGTYRTALTSFDSNEIALTTNTWGAGANYIRFSSTSLQFNGTLNTLLAGYNLTVGNSNAYAVTGRRAFIVSANLTSQSANSLGENGFEILKVGGTINLGNGGDQTIYGVKVAPTLTNLSGSRYVALQTDTGSVKFRNSDVEITGSLTVSGSSTFTNIGPANFTGSVGIYKSGSTVLNVEGSSGQLFSITDSLTGSLFSVNTVAGLPVVEAFSDNTVNIGKFGVYPIKVVDSGSSAVITGSLFGTASFAETASYINPLVQNVQITGLLTGSRTTTSGTTTPTAIFHNNGNASNNTVYEVLRVSNTRTTSSPANGFGLAQTFHSVIAQAANSVGEVARFQISAAMGTPTRVYSRRFDFQIKGDNSGDSLYTGFSYVNDSGTSGLGYFQIPNGPLSIGTTTSSARLHVKGSGTTSATTSLLVENANASASLEILDNGVLKNYAYNSAYPSLETYIDGTKSGIKFYRQSDGYSGRIEWNARYDFPDNGGNFSFGANNSSQFYGNSSALQQRSNTPKFTWVANSNSGKGFYLQAPGSTNSFELWLHDNYDQINKRKVISISNNSNFTFHKSGSTDNILFISQSGEVEITGSLNTSGSTNLTGSVGISGETTLYKSGSTVLDVQGSQGQLFSVVDELSGSLMSVNDVSGLPILEVFSDDRVEMGTYGSPGLVVTGSDVTLANILTITPQDPLPTGVPTGSFAVSSSAPPKPYFWDGSNWNALY